MAGDCESFAPGRSGEALELGGTGARPLAFQRNRNTAKTNAGTVSRTPTMPTASHKLGANRRELTRTPRQKDKNFKQSRDIREDRGERQSKTVGTLRRGR